MPIDGSIHDAHTILLGVEEEVHFPPDFKEYIRKEQLNWSRFEADLPDLNALQKLISKDELGWHLVQFWAATKTSEGRTLLTTQFQPFALGKTSYASDARNRLCEYRMGMCREYNSFYADAECAQEQLGLPGRVFLHQFPEFTPHVKHYTLKEYPQRDLALRCSIVSSWAVPVFDHSSHTCVGVLEIVSPLSFIFMPPVWHDKSILGQMYDVFQDDEEPPLPELATTIVDDGVEQKQREELRKMRDREVEEAIAKFRRTLKAVGPNLPDGGVKMRAGIKRYQDEIDRRRLCRLEKDDDEEEPPLPELATTIVNDGVEQKQREELRKMRDRELKDAIAKFRRTLKAVGPNLPDGGVKMRAGIKRYQDEIDHRRLCQLEKVHFFRVAWDDDEEEPPFPELATTIVNDGVEQKQREELQKMTDRELKEAIAKFRRTLKAVGPNLPDGGVKMRAGIKRYQDEIDHRRLCRPEKDDEEEEPPLPELATTIVNDGVEQKQREELRKMRGRELEEAIAKFRRTLKAVGPNLPDGGVKMRAGIKRDQDEIDRRRLCRLEKLRQLDQASTSAIHSGMNVVSKDQNYILPSLESLQNGEVTMQLDSCDQLSMDPSKNAQNVVIAERNITVITSSEGGPRETQERQHKNTGVQIEVSLDDILKYSKKSHIDAAKKLQALNSVAHTKLAFQDADILTIKAKYENNTIKFRLSLPSRLVVLQQEVASRLNLEAGTYYVRYKDEENELILIACDEDLQGF
ncbi:hypothetical protein RHMOL_Rhmol02G0309800 [Rhododendron molle]|uniref:Uncharacterized protein n=1 Tax=Rhododendron molle TaxID=49168 RepID=A0ACC0PXS8_RHOML|nr:hypothetical protein RHMOL_Rhmol02G0309800 [Rhododendron molle]